MLRWTERARRDLVDIARFIERDNLRAAQEWVDRIRARARSAAKRPMAGRVVPEFGRKKLREILVGHYRVVYCLAGKDIVVLTVFEGHRLLCNLQEDPAGGERT